MIDIPENIFPYLQVGAAGSFLPHFEFLFNSITSCSISSNFLACFLYSVSYLRLPHWDLSPQIKSSVSEVVAYGNRRK